MLQQFESHIQSKQLFQKNDLLIIGVSGGADSVALCELCHRAGYRFEMAHCNFQLRGDESGRDEAYVKTLAEKYGVRSYHTRFDTVKYATDKKISIEVAARELRYQWFDTLVKEKKENAKEAVFLLTAHHANDNIETLLMNFFKGTGIKGLQGIPERKGYVIRPLLFTTRDAIEQFLNENGIEYMVDSTNLSDEYTRNFFRNSLLPQIKRVFPEVETNLLNNIQRFQDIRILYDEAIALKKKKIVEIRGGEVHIPVLKLLKTQPLKTVLFEIVKEYGFLPGQINGIVSLLQSGSGKYIASATHRILHNRKWLIITPLQEHIAEHILIEKDRKNIVFPAGILTIEKKEWYSSDKISADRNVAILDAKNIAYPLLLRKWKEGDYFYPLGMEKKKKLSRFFIDQKMSLPEKENTWVIEQNKKILWIVGNRIDNRFKVLHGTKEAVLLRVETKR